MADKEASKEETAAQRQAREALEPRKVRMLVQVSGSRVDADGNASDWPAPGGVVEVPARDMPALLSSGAAVAEDAELPTVRVPQAGVHLPAWLGHDRAYRRALADRVDEDETVEVPADPIAHPDTAEKVAGIGMDRPPSEQTALRVSESGAGTPATAVGSAAPSPATSAPGSLAPGGPAATPQDRTDQPVQPGGAQAPAGPAGETSSGVAADKGSEKGAGASSTRGGRSGSGSGSKS
jgi:hypothetical protein